jgi:methylated-DNA-[protein]-cysteine S-methyltransferase
MPATIGHTLFETRFGFVGFAWSEGGLTRLLLPDRRAAIERRLDASAGSVQENELPSAVATLVADIKRYFEGEEVSFDHVAVDLDGVDAFRSSIYQETRQLGFGETTNYGELARRAGHAGMARETGQALGSNPVPLIVPCHRILAAGARIGGFSAPGGASAKEKMLALEGVRVGPPPQAQLSLGL